MKPIPPSTAQSLLNPAPPGERHNQMVRLALQLVRCGLVSDAIEIQFRDMYDYDVSDEEISDVVSWAEENANQPRRPSKVMFASAKQRSAPADTRTGEQRVIERLAEFRCTEDQVREAAQLSSSLTPLEEASAFLSALYDAGDLVNIVTQCKIEASAKGEKKAKPIGYGKTMTRDAWLASLKNGGVPQGMGGTWVRLNPTDGKGIADANVARYKYLLMESDCLTLELQISFMAQLKLPLVAIVHSGGKSYHAVVEVNAKDGREYAEVAHKIYRLIELYGFDPSNKNPSRMSRLPGAVRSVGQTGDGRQREERGQCAGVTTGIGIGSVASHGCLEFE